MPFVVGELACPGPLGHWERWQAAVQTDAIVGPAVVPYTMDVVPYNSHCVHGGPPASASPEQHDSTDYDHRPPTLSPRKNRDSKEDSGPSLKRHRAKALLISSEDTAQVLALPLPPLTSSDLCK